MFKKLKEILYRSMDIKEISYKKLKEMVAKDNQIILVDVRSKQEYEEEHIEGAINISLYNLERLVVEKQKMEFKKDDTIILYCSSGNRSRKAKEILEEAGYKNVYNLKNGINEI